MTSENPKTPGAQRQPPSPSPEDGAHAAGEAYSLYAEGPYESDYHIYDSQTSPQAIAALFCSRPSGFAGFSFAGLLLSVYILLDALYAQREKHSESFDAFEAAVEDAFHTGRWTDDEKTYFTEISPIYVVRRNIDRLAQILGSIAEGRLISENDTRCLSLSSFSTMLNAAKLCLRTLGETPEGKPLLESALLEHPHAQALLFLGADSIISEACNGLWAATHEYHAHCPLSRVVQDIPTYPPEPGQFLQ